MTQPPVKVLGMDLYVIACDEASLTLPSAEWADSIAVGDVISAATPAGAAGDVLDSCSIILRKVRGKGRGTPTPA